MADQVVVFKKWLGILSRISTTWMSKHKNRNKNKNKNRQFAENRKYEAGPAWHEDLHPETKNSILAVVCFALSAITLLSYWHKAGFIGEFVFGVISWLFGNGYFLAPLTLLLVGFSFLYSLRRKLMAATVIGAFFFFSSALGILDLLFKDMSGGHIGFYFTYPFFGLFDFWATLVIESAVLAASVMIMLNVPILRFREDVEKAENEKSNAASPQSPLPLEQIKDAVSGAVKAVTASSQAVAAPSDDKRTILMEDKTKSGKDDFLTDKKIKLRPYKKPPFNLLSGDKGTPSSGDIRANANIIKRTLQSFGIDVEMDEVSVGPTVTQYTLKPAEGVKLSRIVALQNDLSLALAAHPIRIEAPIPGRSLVGIEIPNRSIALVGLRSLMESAAFQESTSPLIFALGRDVAGEAVFANLTKMPHLLIAGATGSGKSVSIHTILTSFLFRNSPEIMKFLLIDPKRVELSVYNEIPHLLSPVIVDSKKAIMALRWAVREMEERYEHLSQEKARDVSGYNAKVAKVRSATRENGKGSEEIMPDLMPYIVIVIDELADLMVAYPREVEASIIRLAQMARAVGIHLIVSTQRPSVEVITGLIKANITSRIAFQVASQIDSRTILDMSGADKLLGSGDMLFLAGDTGKPRRIQGVFISEPEVKRVVEFLKNENDEAVDEVSADIFTEITSASSPESHQGSINFDDFGDSSDDELYDEAEKLVIEAGKASASYLQRRLKIGYARAARLLDMLEENGIIGPGEGAKPREILVAKDEVREE